MPLFRIIANEVVAWADELTRRIPGRTGFLVRRVWMRNRLAALGASSAFGMGTLVDGGENIRIGNNFSMMRDSSLSACDGVLEIGDRVSINSRVSIDASQGGRIIIGNDVLVGQNVVLRASNHLFSDTDAAIVSQGHTGGEIVVEDDVWIGANVVIVAGVTIGAHAVVAAGAVVTHQVEAWTVVGGVPARVISHRLEKQNGRAEEVAISATANNQKL